MSHEPLLPESISNFLQVHWLKKINKMWATAMAASFILKHIKGHYLRNILHFMYYINAFGPKPSNRVSFWPPALSQLNFLINAEPLN